MFAARLEPPYKELPSLDVFCSEYMAPAASDGDNAGTPVVITGAMEDWPARRLWQDSDYLHQQAGARTVPVE
eukprot:gene1494-2121_t